MRPRAPPFVLRRRRPPFLRAFFLRRLPADRLGELPSGSSTSSCGSGEATAALIDAGVRPDAIDAFDPYTRVAFERRFNDDDARRARPPRRRRRQLCHPGTTAVF